MMRGPGRRGQPMPPMSMKGQWRILMRVMKMVMKHYAPGFIVALACIAISIPCMLQSSVFTQELFNIYIPGIRNGALTYADLGVRIAKLAAVLLLAVACSYAQ